MVPEEALVSGANEVQVFVLDGGSDDPALGSARMRHRSVSGIARVRSGNESSTRASTTSLSRPRRFGKSLVPRHLQGAVRGQRSRCSRGSPFTTHGTGRCGIPCYASSFGSGEEARRRAGDRVLSARAAPALPDLRSAPASAPPRWSCSPTEPALRESRTGRDPRRAFADLRKRDGEICTRRDLEQDLRQIDTGQPSPRWRVRSATSDAGSSTLSRGLTIGLFAGGGEILR